MARRQRGRAKDGSDAIKIVDRIDDLASSRGSGLVESVLALGLAMMAIAGLGAVVVSGMRAVREARFVQQATALAREAIEETRDHVYTEVALVDADLAGDPDILPGDQYDPDGAGPLVAEDLVTVASGGSLEPHVTTENLQGKTFTVKRYATWVDSTTQGGAARDYKRLTVVVSWDLGSSTREHRNSTLITNARAGLPTPRFEVTPSAQSVAVQPGFPTTLTFRIRNFGLRDTYDVTLPSPPGRSWNFTLYNDADADGVYDAGTDLPLADTNGTGVVDTGTVETNDATFIVAHITMDAAEPVGTETVTFTGTSGADSLHVHSVDATVQVGDAGLELWLHDDPTPPTSDSVSNKNMTMDGAAGTAASLRSYSTDLYTGHPGRFVDDKAIAASESDQRYMANWLFQLGEETTFDGDATVRIWVAAEGHSCTETVTLDVFVRWKNSAVASNGTTLASGSVASVAGAGCGLRQATITLPVDATVAKNKWMELKIGVNPSSGGGALLAYDTTTYPGKLTLPAVAL